jgi:hypothetical protein
MHLSNKYNEIQYKYNTFRSGVCLFLPDPWWDVDWSGRPRELQLSAFLWQGSALLQLIGAPSMKKPSFS